jgi:hypothetical protein
MPLRLLLPAIEGQRPALEGVDVRSFRGLAAPEDRVSIAAVVARLLEVGGG